MKRLIFTIILLCAAGMAWAQGIARNDCTLESKILKTTTHYSIYLPEGYEQSTVDYPVLYLLHGGGDNWKDWLLKGQAAAIADGAHNWSFWRKCLPHAMKWASECFLQERTVPMGPTSRL